MSRIGKKPIELPEKVQAEIGQKDSSGLSQQDVGRLDVPMQDSLTVGVTQRVPDCSYDFEDPILCRPAAVQNRLERLAFNKFHHQEWLPEMISEVVDRNDVGVVELGDHLCLPLEPPQELGILHKGGMHYLDGDVAVQRRMVRLEDRSHSALAELLDDPIRADVFAWLEGHGGCLRLRLDNHQII